MQEQSVDTSLVIQKNQNMGKKDKQIVRECSQPVLSLSDRGLRQALKERPQHDYRLG